MSASRRLGPLGLLAQARGAFLWPVPVADEPVDNAAAAPTLPADRPLRVVTWNLQFAAGREQAFFYDYGDATSVPRGTVLRTLDAMAELLHGLRPDVVLLQEVDRGARRTGYIDQHAWLSRALDLPCRTSSCYWRAPYVPTPAHAPLGKVELHLSVLGRYRLGAARRHALPLLHESPLRQLFNLKRALLEVTVPTDDGRAITLANTHLSAFSRGDGTLDRQLALIDARLAALEAAGEAWMIAGDFNTLAPADDVARLPAVDRGWYPEASSPILPLLARWGDPVGVGWRADPDAWRTFLPFGAARPDRTLDYLLHGTRVEVLSHRVVHEASALSDHLPLLTEIRLAP